PARRRRLRDVGAPAEGHPPAGRHALGDVAGLRRRHGGPAALHPLARGRAGHGRAERGARRRLPRRVLHRSRLQYVGLRAGPDPRGAAGDGGLPRHRRLGAAVLAVPRGGALRTHPRRRGARAGRGGAGPAPQPLTAPRGAAGCAPTRSDTRRAVAGAVGHLVLDDTAAGQVLPLQPTPSAENSATALRSRPYRAAACRTDSSSASSSTGRWSRSPWSPRAAPPGWPA